MVIPAILGTMRYSNGSIPMILRRVISLFIFIEPSSEAIAEALLAIIILAANKGPSSLITDHTSTFPIRIVLRPIMFETCVMITMPITIPMVAVERNDSMPVKYICL